MNNQDFTKSLETQYIGIIRRSSGQVWRCSSLRIFCLGSSIVFAFLQSLPFSNTNARVVISGFPENRKKIDPQPLHYCLYSIKNHPWWHWHCGCTIYEEESAWWLDDLSHYWWDLGVWAFADSAAANVETRVSIAVSYANTSFDHKIIAAKRKIGNPKFSKLDKLQLSTFPTLANLPGDLYIYIYVNELLPIDAFKLFGKAKSILKPAGFIYIWFKNGMVHGKKDELALPQIHYTEQEDVDGLLALYRQIPLWLVPPYTERILWQFLPHLVW